MIKRLLSLFLAFAVSAQAASITFSGSDLSAPGPIGGTTPAAGSFTTLSASGVFTAAASGTKTAPSITFSGHTNMGWYYRFGSTMAGAAGGNEVIHIQDSGNINIGGASAGISFGAGSLEGTGTDTTILRDASNTLALRNGANDQTFKLYGLYTDASNYHNASFAMSDTAFTISTQTAGTGVDSLPININPSSAAAGRFDDTAVAGQTRFLLYDVDNGTLERVTVGAADSGGAGFKVLRIPN